VNVKPDNLVARRPEHEGAMAQLQARLGEDAAQHISQFLQCSRCLQPCEVGSQCRVPHPPHMQQDAGSTFSDTIRHSHVCLACNRSYSVTTFRDAGADGVVPPDEYKGPRWCFEGAHTTLPLPPSDERRVRAAMTCLKAGPSLQDDIDALPDTVEILRIDSGSHFHDSSCNASLTRPLPSLCELQLHNVTFQAISLTPATTPNLRKLSMQNVPDDCRLELVLPNLRSFSVHFWGGDSGVINRMLDATPLLEEFDSYKLWVDELHFASNHLTSIDLHRSDSLSDLSIWAPNLESLSLQGCYSVEDITFLQTHKLASDLPPGHRPPPLEVNTLNACLGPRAQRALQARGYVPPSRGVHAGMPTEALFAQMGLGGFGPFWPPFMGGSSDDSDDDDYDDDDDSDDDDDGGE